MSYHHRGSVPCFEAVLALILTVFEEKLLLLVGEFVEVLISFIVFDHVLNSRQQCVKR